MSSEKPDAELTVRSTIGRKLISIVLIGIATIILVAVPSNARAKALCMGDSELYSYLLWLGATSSHMKARLCIKSFPEFRPDLNEVLSENHELKTHGEKAVQAYERAYPGHGRQRFLETVTALLTNSYKDKKITRKQCRDQFVRLRLLKQGDGTYMSVFRNEMEPHFDVERQLMPQCEPLKLRTLRQAR